MSAHSLHLGALLLPCQAILVLSISWPSQTISRPPPPTRMRPPQIALPSTAAICLDWWTYEAIILIAGALPDAKVQLGAMGGCGTVAMGA